MYPLSSNIRLLDVLIMYILRLSRYDTQSQKRVAFPKKSRPVGPLDLTTAAPPWSACLRPEIIPLLLSIITLSFPKLKQHTSQTKQKQIQIRCQNVCRALEVEKLEGSKIMTIVPLKTLVDSVDNPDTKWIICHLLIVIVSP